MDFQSPHSLALLHALESSCEEILQRWEEAVRTLMPAAQGLSKPVLRDHLPVFLNSVLVTLRGNGKPSAKTSAVQSRKLGEEHGAQRSKQTGFSLSDILKEYRIFRAELFRYLGEKLSLPLEQQLFLHEQLDKAVEGAVEAYTEEAKVIRERLQEGEQREEILVKLAASPTYDFDLRSGLSTWNEAILREFGHDLRGTLETTGWWLENVHPDDLARVQKAYATAVAHGDPWRESYRFRRADGNYVHVQDRAFFVKDANGRAARMIGVLEDVSARKIEESLARDAAAARDTFFNLPGLLFCVASLDGYFTRLNPAWEKHTGHSQAELLSTPFLDFVHPADQPATSRELASLAQGNRSVGFLNRYRHQNGSYRWLHWTIEKVGDQLYGLALDVTGVKETEGQLHRSWDRFDRVSMATGLGVWYCDLPFDVLEWNEKVKEHFWLAPDATVTIQLFYERIHPEDRELTRRAIDESNRTGERYDIVYRTVNPANPAEVKWIRAVGWTAYDEAGTPTSFDGFTLDVTENRRVESALEESQAAIQRSEQQLKLITDRLPAFVAYVDREQRYTFVNQTYENWFGRSPAELIGRKAWEVMGQDVYDRAKVYVETALSGRTATYENTLRQASGREIYVHVEYLPDFHPRTGEVRGYVVVAHDITNLKQSQKALAASATRFRSLTETIPQIVCTSDPSGHLDWYSQQWFDYTGLSPTSGEHEWTLAIHPEDLGRTHARWQHSMRTGEPYEIEYRIRRHDGEYRWFLGRALPVRDASGAITQWLGTNTDIHDSYETTRLLQQRSEHFQLITEIIPQGIWRTNPDGSGDYFSQRFAELVGYSVPELLGWGWSEIIHPEDRPRVLEEWQRCRAMGKPVAVEFRVRAAEGRYRWFISLGNPFRDESGEIIKYYGTWTDIDSQKIRAAQLQALAETSLRLNSTRTLSEKLSILPEAARQIVGAHQGFATLDVHSEELLQHFSYSSKYAPASYPPLRFETADVAPECRPDSRPVRFSSEQLEANPFGQLLAAAQPGHPPLRGWLAAPLLNSRGERIGSIQLSEKYEGEFSEDDESILAQLAQIASAAIENSELLSREQEAVRARDEFLSIASHELKTPLTSLKLQTQVFRRMVDKGMAQAYSPERVNGIMDQTHRQVNRLTRLVDDMLDISRIRTGKLSIEKQTADFCALVRDSVERMHSHFRDAGFPDPELECSGSAVLELDPVRIEQVVNNLLTNALRYGLGKPVSVRVAHAGGKVLLSVTDRGLGIAPENHHKIFDRFERAVSANEVSGLGLGLFITRQIIAAHGGRIWVESRLGEGSTFHVELPLSEAGQDSHSIAR